MKGPEDLGWLNFHPITCWFKNQLMFRINMFEFSFQREGMLEPAASFHSVGCILDLRLSNMRNDEKCSRVGCTSAQDLD